MFKVLGEAVAKFQADYPGEAFWGLRTIWSTMRDQGPRPIIEDADDCLATKLAFPQLVAGYDLAGSEIVGRPIVDLLPELFWFRKQCALEGVNIPFFFRAAECGVSDTAEGNIFDAMLLGSRRIGNPLTLHKHPGLVETIRTKRILIECSPVSGTGTVDLNHAFPALLAQGVSCVLCHDNSGMLSGSGHDVGRPMTNIFWQTLQAWEGIDLATLGSLAENSVRWAAFEDQDPDTWYVHTTHPFFFTFAHLCCVMVQISLPTGHCPRGLRPQNPGEILRNGRLADIKFLSFRLRTVREASTGTGVKAARLRSWAVEWEQFCLWVVTEYGETSGDGAGSIEDRARAAV